MGAPAAVGPPAATVASQFTTVYYGVAASQPHRLAELYGPDSQLSHAPAALSTGLDAIAASAKAGDLPLASSGTRAIVRSVDAMASASGGYVVLVVGDLAGQSFAQTFFLERAAGKESAEHFYCRNDIFRFIHSTPRIATAATAAPVAPIPIVSGIAPGSNVVEPPAPVTTAVPVPIATNVPATAACVNIVAPASSASAAISLAPAAVTPAPAVAASASAVAASTPTVAEPSPIVAAPAPAASSFVTDPIANLAAAPADVAPVVDNAPPAELSKTGEPVDATELANSPMKYDDKPAESKPAANGADDADAKPSYVAPAKPAASVKPAAPKSWAAIARAAASPSADALAAVPTAAPTTSSAAVSPAFSAKTSYTAPPASAVFSASAQNTKPSTNGNASSSNTANGSGWSSVDSKRTSSNYDHQSGGKSGGANGHNNAHGGFKQQHPASRVYGPSAVIQLGGLPSERVREWRSLQAEFTAEFATYGFEVRNVEVKSHKGLAFVEYDTIEGVQAAVNVWSKGPRRSGPFKGVTLSVTEKRQRKHVPGGGGAARGGASGGGGAGMRGGRGGGNSGNRPGRPTRVAASGGSTAQATAPVSTAPAPASST
jgi:Nuclear transport factor 2 (NTF2) domain